MAMLIKRPEKPPVGLFKNAQHPKSGEIATLACMA
jgi:hypothetical protein